MISFAFNSKLISDFQWDLCMDILVCRSIGFQFLSDTNQSRPPSAGPRTERVSSIRQAWAINHLEVRERFDANKNDPDLCELQNWQ